MTSLYVSTPHRCPHTSISCLLCMSNLRRRLCPFHSAVTVHFIRLRCTLWGDACTMKTRYLAECNRVLKKGGLLSFSGHDYTFLKENYPDCLREKNFILMPMEKFIGKHMNLMNCRTLPIRPAWTLFCVKKERFIGLRMGQFCIACAKKRTEN